MRRTLSASLVVLLYLAGQAVAETPTVTFSSLLTYSPKGYTVKELVSLSGMSDKTVRRDLIFFQRVGFDLSETVGEYGRKRWRIRRMPESMAVRGGVREKYALIYDTLGDLRDAARIIGDTGLAVALKQLQEWVEGECRSRKVKPR